MEDEIDGALDLEPTVITPKGNQADGKPQGGKPDDDDDQDDLPDDGEGGDDDGEGDKPEPEDTIEFEEGGKKFKVPAALKGALLRQQEFSRRMNEVAAQRREIETTKADLSKWREAEEADQLAVGRLAHVDGEIKRFEKVNWPAFYAQNPQKAAAAQGQLTQLQTQRNQLKEQIEAGKAKRETEAKTALSERLRATREFAQAEIPGWTPERDKQIAKLATDTGISKEELFSVMSPAVYRLLDLALTGQKYREASAKAKKTAAGAKADDTRPLERVGSRKAAGTVAALSDKAPAKDWIAARNAQVRKSANAR